MKRPFFLLLWVMLFVIGPTSHIQPTSPRPFVAELAAGDTPFDTAACLQQFSAACYQPAQIQRAYNLGPLYKEGLNGDGRTIVIVNPFGSPTIEHDLEVFDATFGLPAPPSFKIVQPVGPPPAFDPAGDQLIWAKETTLDVEWAHVIAPGASILLVETPVDETEGVDGFPEIVQAENYVIDNDLGDVISQSFGATEATFANRGAVLQLRSALLNALAHKVTVLASSGDTGVTGFKSDQSCCYADRAIVWPSSDPLVTSVGGTSLHLDADGNRTAPDTTWNDKCESSTADCAGASGGGTSAFFARPGFQDDVASVVGDRRGTPDISMNASFDGAVVIYYTFVKPESPWHLAGASSEASPLLAGVVAIADQAAGHRLGWLNPRLYRLGSNDLVDVTSGSNTFTYCDSACASPSEVDHTVAGYQAQPGYDLASGLGTVDATRLVHALADDAAEDKPEFDARTDVEPGALEPR